MKYCYYAVYGIGTIGVMLSVLTGSFVLAIFCVCAIMVALFDEAREFAPKWPVKGTKDYDDMVHRMHEAIIKGKNKSEMEDA